MAVGDSLLDAKRLQNARIQIERRFLDQVLSGAPTTTMGRTDHAACGQYLLEASAPQRGLLGTAAAIQVLSQSKIPEARRATERLIRWVGESAFDDDHDRDKVVADRTHVVKAAELVRALTAAGAAGFDVRDLKEEIADRLEAGRVATGFDTGWPYFVRDIEDGVRTDQSIELIPTASAVLALEQAGRPQPDAIRFLASQIDDTRQLRQVATEFPVEIQVTVTLLQLCPQPGLDESRLQGRLVRHAHELRPLLRSDIEARFECRGPAAWFNLRVAWQLALLDGLLACHPRSVLLSPDLRQLFERVLTATEGTAGYRYPFSGRGLSSRTSATVHEVLRSAEDGATAHPDAYVGARAIAAFRAFVDSRFLQVLSRALSATVVVASVVAWTMEGASLAQVAPNIIFAILVSMLTLRRP